MVLSSVICLLVIKEAEMMIKRIPCQTVKFFLEIIQKKGLQEKDPYGIIKVYREKRTSILSPGEACGSLGLTESLPFTQFKIS